MEGQHQSPFEIVYSNVKEVLNDVISKLEDQDCRNNIDFAQFKIDWICALLLRMGGILENSLLPYLLQAHQILTLIDKNEDICCTDSLPQVKTGFKERPKFDIPIEQLEYLLDNGFKATDIAKMLCVSEKTVYRRL